MPRLESKVFCSPSSEGDSKVRARYRRRDGKLLTDLCPDGFAAALRDDEGLRWFDAAGDASE